MAFKTFTDGSVLTASDVNTYLMGQAVIGCTSGTRPTGVEGMVIWETDTDRLLYYSGAAWVIITEPRQTWTPSIVQSTTVSGTVNRGWYRRENGLWHAQLAWTASGAGTAGNAIAVTTPVTMLDTNDLGGTFQFNDGGTHRVGRVGPNNVTSGILWLDNNTGGYGATPSFAIAASDQLFLSMWGSY